MRLVILYYVSCIGYVPFILSLPLTEFGGGPKGLRSSGCAQGLKVLWLWRGEDKLLVWYIVRVSAFGAFCCLFLSLWFPLSSWIGYLLIIFRIGLVLIVLIL